MTGGGGDATETSTAAATPKPSRRRMHPLLRWAFIGLAVVAGLVAIDTGVRLFVQWRIAESVEAALPLGVSGDVDARVHGFSAIWQLARGELDHLELASDDLSVLGVTIEARVDAYGVSFGGSPVPVVRAEQLTGQVFVSTEAINTLVPVPGASGGVELGEGTVAYSTSMSFLGLTVDVDIEAIVAMQGDRLIIEATSIEFASGDLGFDAAGLLANATVAVPICTADYLPSGVHLTSVRVEPEGVTVEITANEIALDEATLDARDTCR